MLDWKLLYTGFTILIHYLKGPSLIGNGNLLGSAVLGWGWSYQLFNLDKVDWGSMQPQGVLKHYHDLFACIWMPTTHQHQNLG